MGSLQVVPFEKPYGEWVIERLHALLHQAQHYTKNTTADDLRWVQDIIEQAALALQVPFTPTIVMEDYKEGNVVMQRASDGPNWQVTGVFDLMTAHYGDPEADLSRAVGDYARQNPAWARTFVESYLRCRPPRPGFEERFRLYLLHDSLILWEYFQRTGEGIPDNQETSLRRWVEPLMTGAGVG